MKIRIAFREEGNFWNAYLALADTMEKAKLIGSVSMGPVARNPEIKEAFMNTMKMILAEAIKNTTGQETNTWITERAPETER